ncbi:MAG TPA: cytochrome P450 [Actinomycetota bacterium]
MAEAARLPLSRTAALRMLRRDPIRLLERAATAGDVVVLPMLRFDAYLLNRPDLVWDVLATHGGAFHKGPTMQAAKRVLGESLLTSEGERHRRQRRMIQPMFHHERVATYGDEMVTLAERAAERWVDGTVMDVHREMAQLTLAIVARTLFGSDVDADDAVRIGEALRETLGQFDRAFSPLLPITERLPLPSTRRFHRARAVMDHSILAMIAERRATGAHGEDLLSLLMTARDADVAMDDTEVRDEAMTLFLAGHETTSNALTWTWFLLSEHPDVATELHGELDGLPGRLDAGSAIPYTSAVVRESMRLYPPAWAIGRRAIEDHTADGVRIPAGSVVVVSPWLLHHDPRWWPEADRFLPERWLEIDVARPRHAYLPFGGGSRMCIGEGFAELETRSVLGTIARHWSFTHVPSHRVELQPVVTLRPRTGMPMVLHRRVA